MRDAISAIDKRIAQKAPYPFEEGIIQSVNGNNVLVQLLGSSSSVNAYCDPSINPEKGKSCILAFLPNRGKYVVASLFVFKASEDTFSNSTPVEQELFPPGDIELSDYRDFALLRWSGVSSLQVVYEVQITFDSDNPADYFTAGIVSGSLWPLDYQDVEFLARVRSVSQGKHSSWSVDVRVPLQPSPEIWGPISNGSSNPLVLNSENEIILGRRA